MSSYHELDDQDEKNLDKKKTSDLRSLLFLVKYSKKYGVAIVGSLLLLVLYSAVALYSSRLTGLFVDEGLLKSDRNRAIFLGLSVVGLELLSIIFHWIGRTVLAQRASLVVLDIRKGLFQHLQKLPLQFYDRWPQGRVITRITHDVEGLENFFTNSLGRMCSSIFMAISAVIVMCSSDLKLGLMILASIFPALIFVLLTRSPVKKVNRKMSKFSSIINSKLTEFIDGIYVIRSFGLEGWSMKKYKATIDDHINSSLEANLLYSWSQPLLSFLCACPLLVLIWFGGQQVMDGTMSVGLFVAFTRYSEKFFFPIMNLFRELHVIFQAFTNTERVANFFEQSVEDEILKQDDNPISKGDFRGEIEFRDVSMGYDDNSWVLKNVNFHIKQGERIGLVGHTGCGKTTTISLLSRLYEFQEGEVLIDGNSVRSFDRTFLRSHIGVVSQDSILFHGTLRENLSLNTDQSDEEVLRISEQTGLLKVMNDAKISLTSMILEGGVNLSVGQRQLICLTRVFLTNPSILVLDEATANIDPQMEEVIHSALKQLMDGRTTLMIAHRLDTLSGCDRLFVFEKGEIVEQGGPRELIEKKGRFYELHKAGQKRETTNSPHQ
ncbi:ABC transporter transmembrane region [Bacteriovorax sp. BSW11_IV]|uniref:ABC transporter ATP-binding protein n=1 Tax=Bacteriovorax sp. BSW11_IV TaxID=1353529 RepID=UPI00038A24D0|nr:ABC transporter ATP-binding protein [Bacteriovorax sp. BSW11_IV]EQC48442.1 ABC transporter transmembrane region [Bacteriovorax sp. BSW11_IV]